MDEEGTMTEWIVYLVLGGILSGMTPEYVTLGVAVLWPAAFVTVATIVLRDWAMRKVAR
jgi:hypothetical protein